MDSLLGALATLGTLFAFIMFVGIVSALLLNKEEGQ